METVEPLDVDDAARQLASELKRRHVLGIVAVGVRHGTPEIIVYVVRVTPQLRHAIPESWKGVPVTMKRSGSISPA